MNIRMRLFFISLSIVSFAQSSGTFEVPRNDTATTQTKYTEYFVINKEVLKRLVPLIQHYAQLIKNNRIKVTDPVSASVWCQEMSSLIGMLLREPQPVLDAQFLAKFSFMVDSLITMIQTVSRNNFSQLPPLNPEVLFAQGTPRSIAPNKLSTYVQSLVASIEELEKEALQKGFTWYNRVYRGMSNFCDRWYISTAMQKAKSAAYVGSFFGAWYFLTNYHWLNDEDRKFLWGVNIYTEDRIKTLQSKEKAPEIDRYSYRDALYLDVISPAMKRDLKTAHMLSILAKMGFGSLEALMMMGKAKEGFNEIDKMMGITETLVPLINTIDAKLRGIDIQQMGDLTYVHHITLDDLRFGFIRPLFRVFEQILEYVRDPNRFVTTGLKIPKKIVITGGSGQGKTLLAEGLCGSLNEQAAQSQSRKFAFLRIEPHQLFAWGENAVSRIMAEARQHAPCVVYIDEIHALNLQVNGNSKLMTEWLMELDKLDKNDDPDHQIILIASTNKENLLDIALLRDGRFDERIHLDAPSRDERAFMITTFCRMNAVDTATLDIEFLAAITAGASRSSMNKICETASSLAKMENSLISYEHFYQAINKHLRKIQLQSRLTDDEKWQLAVYQAGVALALIFKQESLFLDAVTIKGCLAEVVEKYDHQIKFEGGDKDARIEYGKAFTYRASEQKGIISFAAQKEQAKVLLAGSAAQKIILGSETSYRIEDRNIAIQNMQSIHLKGSKWENLSEKRQNDIKDAVCSEIVTLDEEMEVFMTEHKNHLLAIAEELKIKEYLTVDEIKAIIDKN